MEFQSQEVHFELYPKMNRETVPIMEISYSTAVELEEAINALQLSGVVEE